MGIRRWFRIQPFRGFATMHPNLSGEFHWVKQDVTACGLKIPDPCVKWYPGPGDERYRCRKCVAARRCK